MRFAESISSGFHRYFDFRTRSSRSECWWWFVFGILVSIAATVLDRLLFGGLAILDPISSLALIIPGLAVGVRRLHDVNRSGWWTLIAFSIVGIIFPLLYWAIQPGTRGTNKHGPDPTRSPANMTADSAEGYRGSQASAGFCPNCGSIAEPGANFCPSCGAAA